MPRVTIHLPERFGIDLAATVDFDMEPYEPATAHCPECGGGVSGINSIRMDDGRWLFRLLRGVAVSVRSGIDGLDKFFDTTEFDDMLLEGLNDQEWFAG